MIPYWLLNSIKNHFYTKAKFFSQQKQNKKTDAP